MSWMDKKLDYILEGIIRTEAFVDRLLAENARLRDHIDALAEETTIIHGVRQLGKTHQAWHDLIRSGAVTPSRHDPACCWALATFCRAYDSIGHVEVADSVETQPTLPAESPQQESHAPVLAECAPVD